MNPAPSAAGRPDGRPLAEGGNDAAYISAGELQTLAGLVETAYVRIAGYDDKRHGYDDNTLGPKAFAEELDRHGWDALDYPDHPLTVAQAANVRRACMEVDQLVKAGIRPDWAPADGTYVDDATILAAAAMIDRAQENIVKLDVKAYGYADDAPTPYWDAFADEVERLGWDEVLRSDDALRLTPAQVDAIKNACTEARLLVIGGSPRPTWVPPEDLL